MFVSENSLPKSEVVPPDDEAIFADLLEEAESLDTNEKAKLEAAIKKFKEMDL